MTHDPFWLDASDRSRLYVNRWLPATPLKAVILLAHGMAEHSARYARLADTFCDKDYGVYAPDLRGHGRTADNGTLGHDVVSAANEISGHVLAYVPTTGEQR